MLRLLLGALLAPVVLAAVPAAWQEPKPGNEWYEDGTMGYLGPQWAALIIARLAGIR